MGKRCQVCDGPVVNGRCKLCGMPYRNDEILYHLNETSRDHYRHASEAVRKEMRENQIPAADRQKAAREAQASRMRNASDIVKRADNLSSMPGKTAGHTSRRGENGGKRAADSRNNVEKSAKSIGSFGRSSERMDAKGNNSGRMDAKGNSGGRVNAKGNGSGKADARVIGSRGMSRQYADEGTKKSVRRLSRWLIMILLVVSLGSELISQGISYIREKMYYATHQEINTENLELLAVLDLDIGEIEIQGEDWFWVVPGTYLLEASNGNIQVELEKTDGDTHVYKLHEGEKGKIILMESGDVLRAVSAQNRYSYVNLYLIEQSDE